MLGVMIGSAAIVLVITIASSGKVTSWARLKALARTWHMPRLIAMACPRGRATNFLLETWLQSGNRFPWLRQLGRNFEYPF